MLIFDTVKQYNDWNNHPTLHPLVSVIDLSKADRRKHTKVYMGIYGIFLKKVNCGDLKYGINYYDYDEGTVIFLAPGQTIQSEPFGEWYQPSGTALIFDHALLKGSGLSNIMQKYTFFSYKSTEALHLSEKERSLFLDALKNIQYELENNIDKHSKKLILTNIELILNYCNRFYDRQFITREPANSGIIEKFESLLNEYLYGESIKEFGIPSVQYFAQSLHLSPNYFGDLIKKETGKSAQEYIHLKLLDVAKEKIWQSDKSISVIASEMGFKYPQHFTRLFKQKTGMTPQAFRIIN